MGMNTPDQFVISMTPPKWQSLGVAKSAALRDTPDGSFSGCQVTWRVT